MNKIASIISAAIIASSISSKALAANEATHTTENPEDQKNALIVALNELESTIQNYQPPQTQSPIGYSAITTRKNSFANTTNAITECDSISTEPLNQLVYSETLRASIAYANESFEKMTRAWEQVNELCTDFPYEMNSKAWNKCSAAQEKANSQSSIYDGHAGILDSHLDFICTRNK